MALASAHQTTNGSTAPAATAALRPFGAFRCFLAVLVMIHHFAIELGSPAMVAAVAPRPPGDVAVAVFFMLSGFIIFEAVTTFYARRPAAFLANRLLRIVPPYIAALIAAVLVHAALLHATGRLLEIDGKPLDASIFSAGNLIANVFDIVPGTGFMGRQPSYEFLWLAWTLRVEVLFYVVAFLGMAAAVAWRGRDRFNEAIGWTWALLAVAALPLSVLAIHGLAPNSLQYAPYFAFGAALYLWDSGSRAAGIVALIAVPLMALQFFDHNALFFAEHLPRDQVSNYVMLALVTAGFVFLACRRVSHLARWDRWLGDLSYPIYLNHVTVGVALKTLGAAPGWITVILAMALSVVFSLAMHWLVETRVKPWRDALRGTALN